MKKSKFLKSGVALSLMFAGLTAVSQSSSAASTDPPIINLGGFAKKTTISKTTFAPGVVEFHVTTSPMDPNEGPDNVAIVKTDNLNLVLDQFRTAFTAKDTPAGHAATAAAMRTAHQNSTFYGGGPKGTVWQVNLPAGHYYAVTGNAVLFGEGKPVEFTVAGAPDSISTMHATQMTLGALGAVGANQWEVAQTGKPVQWIQFANNSQEVHFMALNGLRSSTTTSMISKSLASHSEDAALYNHVDPAGFDIISPGVTVVFKQAWKPGKYVVWCFIPSEIDGTAHADQGFWKLYTVKKA